MILWQPDGGGLERGSLVIPPARGVTGPTVLLALVRRAASDDDGRIGTLLVNPGGPGLAGTDLVRTASLFLPSLLLERFDLVGWDPRGTGASTPTIDCVDSYDAVFDGLDSSPDDEAERQRWADTTAAVADGCATRSGDLIGSVGTMQAARDLDTIRRALGEPTVSYMGFSYGSELGAMWATLYPDTVRAAVLDGAVDPTADAAERARQRATGFDRAVDRFVSWCDDLASCAFPGGGDAGAAFDALFAQLDERPIPSIAGRPRVTSEIGLQAVAEAMYAETYWPQLAQALASAQHGDGAGLLALWDAYNLRQPTGTWPNTREAGAVIGCMDHGDRPSQEAAESLSIELRQSAPRYAPGLADLHLCADLPAAPDPTVPITGADAGPILVVGTTGDPATPLPGTQAMADALEGGRLLTVEANQHTGSGTNQCVIDAVSRYLIDLVLPPVGQTCR
ncbi:MAG: alpha/beta hydrolase [Ilumatobacteraceae bacterium]